MSHRIALVSLAAVIVGFSLPGVAVAKETDPSCAKRAYALMVPTDNPEGRNTTPRFGPTTTVFSNQKISGYSLQTVDGSLYFNDLKEPVSLSLSNGSWYTTADKGQTWTLGGSSSKAEMDAVLDELRRRAEKATNIVCKAGIAFNGLSVDYISAEVIVESSGAAMQLEYWIDPETGFVYRDVNTSLIEPKTVITVDAQPAAEMTLPDPER
jgi:hypothetical protein